jgi:hypothetical protein
MNVITEHEWRAMRNQLVRDLWRAVWYQFDEDGYNWTRDIPDLTPRLFDIAGDLLAAAGYTTRVEMEPMSYYTAGYSHEEGNPQ